MYFSKNKEFGVLAVREYLLGTQKSMMARFRSTLFPREGNLAEEIFFHRTAKRIEKRKIEN